MEPPVRRPGDGLPRWSAARSAVVTPSAAKDSAAPSPARGESAVHSSGPSVRCARPTGYFFSMATPRIKATVHV